MIGIFFFRLHGVVSKAALTFRLRVLIDHTLHLNKVWDVIKMFCYEAIIDVTS